MTTSRYQQPDETHAHYSTRMEHLLQRSDLRVEHVTGVRADADPGRFVRVPPDEPEVELNIEPGESIEDFKARITDLYRAHYDAHYAPQVEVETLRTQLFDLVPIMAPDVHAEYRAAVVADVFAEGTDGLVDSMGRLDVVAARDRLVALVDTYPLLSGPRPAPRRPKSDPAPMIKTPARSPGGPLPGRRSLRPLR